MQYVVVEFDSDAEAEAFVTTINGSEGSSGSMRCIGQYKKPSMFCECPEKDDPDRKVTRGAKWGILVHKGCGKPYSGMWQGPKNLLIPDEHIGRRQFMFSSVEPRQ